MADYRLKVEQPDLSGFATQSNSQNGAMVIKSRKGTKKPKLNQGEGKVTLRYGKPNAENFGVFEAIEYAKVSPLYIASALGANYKYAGVDVRTTKVYPFGARSGRIFETFNNSTYNNVEVNVNYTAATGTDGLTSIFTGLVTPPETLPMILSSIQIKVGGNILQASIDQNTGVITGSAFDVGSIIDYQSGLYNFAFVGTPGTVANYTSNIDIVSTVDLSVGNSDKKVNLIIDGVLYQNVNFGQASGTVKSDIVNVINSAVGKPVASVSGNRINIVGLNASANAGGITITAPSLGVSAIPYIFDLSLTTISVFNSTSPTGYIPKIGEKIEINYNYYSSVKDETSFSLFTASPFDDSLETYSVEVTRLTGKQYKVVLNQISDLGAVTIKTYVFSLLREKNSFGKSIYYEDVFREDDYLQIYVNTDYQNIADPIVETVILTGGVRGDEPTSQDYLEAWNNFKQRNLYPVKNFMDCYGTSASTLVDIIANYQPRAFGITVVPLGNDAISAKAYRQSTNIDFDGLALYTNWSFIEDSYNNSYAWTSNVGKIGVKYAQMNDVFDGLAPAGTDENGRGGQLKGGFKIIKLEYDYTEDELQLLNEANINPIIIKGTYGAMIYGDRTLQVINSDTSFIPHRRLFNYMIAGISDQILEKQIFKLNDPIHRLLAKSQSETFLAPIDSLNLVREIYVQCDEENNTDEILQVRQFVLDVFVKVTPFSEFVLLRLTRLPQGATIAQLIQQ